jgi:hypothetical protein
MGDGWQWSTKDSDFALPAPEPVCDVIMKGGITGGVVYPLAITELAKKCRLANIGGTSAGAIAAVAAAGEFGLGHQPGHEGHVARQAVQPGDDHRAFGGARSSERGGKLGPTIERVSAFAGLRFHILADDYEVLGFSEPRDRGALRFDAEPGAVLLPCGDTVVGDSAFHTYCIPPFAVCMT